MPRWIWDYYKGDEKVSTCYGDFVTALLHMKDLHLSLVRLDTTDPNMVVIKVYCKDIEEEQFDE